MCPPIPPIGSADWQTYGRVLDAKTTPSSRTGVYFVPPPQKTGVMKYIAQFLLARM